VAPPASADEARAERHSPRRPHEPRSAPPDTLFYDGHCGLCHWFVRFVLTRDVNGVFVFAPLQGAFFASLVPVEARAAFPDSVVIHTADGRILVRAAAVRHALDRLGGVWRALSAVSGVVPVAWLDRLYDVVARIRRRLFATPPDVCPTVPPHLRRRFRA
jgi:predicted DCC family thiol-disulfide oxidoreductase YuxK